MLVQCIWCGLRCYSTALLFCVLSGPIKNMNLKSLSGIQREHSHYVLESSHRALQSDCCTLHSNSTPRNSCINARIYVEFLWQIIFLKKCLNKEKRTNKFKSGPVFFFLHSSDLLISWHFIQQNCRSFSYPIRHFICGLKSDIHLVPFNAMALSESEYMWICLNEHVYITVTSLLSIFKEKKPCTTIVSILLMHCRVPDIYFPQHVSVWFNGAGLFTLMSDVRFQFIAN